VWSAPFWIGSREPCELKLTACVFGDNLSKMEIPLSISIEVSEDYFDIGADNPELEQS